jgi:hypothetical protein
MRDGVPRYRGFAAWARLAPPAIAGRDDCARVMRPASIPVLGRSVGEAEVRNRDPECPRQCALVALVRGGFGRLPADECADGHACTARDFGQRECAWGDLPLLEADIADAIHGDEGSGSATGIELETGIRDPLGIGLCFTCFKLETRNGGPPAPAVGSNAGEHALV